MLVSTRFRRCCAVLVAALLLAWPMRTAGADERAELRAALKQADAQYRTTLKTLETMGREETSAEVARLRAASRLPMSTTIMTPRILASSCMNNPE